MRQGTKTHTTDIKGRPIRVGDKVRFSQGDNFFIVVFERNAIRKKYDEWERELERPLLEPDPEAGKFLYMIIGRKWWVRVGVAISSFFSHIFKGR